MNRLLMYFPENDLALAAGVAAYTPPLPHACCTPQARRSRYGCAVRATVSRAQA